MFDQIHKTSLRNNIKDVSVFSHKNRSMANHRPINRDKLNHTIGDICISKPADRLGKNSSSNPRNANLNSTNISMSKKVHNSNVTSNATALNTPNIENGRRQQSFFSPTNQISTKITNEVSPKQFNPNKFDKSSKCSSNNGIKSNSFVNNTQHILDSPQRAYINLHKSKDIEKHSDKILNNIIPVTSSEKSVKVDRYRSPPRPNKDNPNLSTFGVNSGSKNHDRSKNHDGSKEKDPRKFSNEESLGLFTIQSHKISPKPPKYSQG
jgi:hypothetical protein